MKFRSLLKVLETQARPKGAEQIAEFLLTTREGDFPLLFSNRPCFMFALLVPNRLLNGTFEDDLGGWNMSMPGGYGYGFTYKDGRQDPCLFDPLDHTGSRILNQALPPLFLRSFPGGTTYLEPNQRLTHVLELHKPGEAPEWSRVNELGELVPTIRSSRGDGLSLCTIDREALNRFLVSADMSVVRLFVVNAATDPSVWTKKAEDRPWSLPKEEIFTRTAYVEGAFVLCRGFDVTRVSAQARAHALLQLAGEEPREYATFLIQDWRNERVVEWPADAAQLGNYFKESELPFETSPAFFKPEVLTQYRTDPSRFRVLPDQVECMAAWSIPYYVNAVGLVHAYICDLSRLPYQEQLRWKAQNVAPDGGLSKQAVERDFLAQWGKDYDPLLSLRQILEEFPAADESGVQCRIWALGSPPPGRDLNFLGYVVSGARKEFDDQVMALAQIVVEGLNPGEVNRLAEALGCRDPKLASLKQLAKNLVALGVGEETIQTVVPPLLRVQGLRSESIAHRGTVPLEGDQRVVFRELLASCDQAMRALASLVRKSVFSKR